jgi:hypothetical protein
MGIRALLEPAAPAEVAFRYFYYEHGWAEGGPQPPASVLDSPFFEDVVTGVAVATVVKQ